jgi:hypothetical protein
MLNQVVLTQNREFKILFQPIIIIDSFSSYSSVIRDFLPLMCKKFGVDINTCECDYNDIIKFYYEGVNPKYTGSSTISLTLETNFCNIERIVDYLITLMGMNSVEFREQISIQPNIEDIIIPLCNSSIVKGDDAFENKNYDNAVLYYKEAITLYTMLSEFSQIRIDEIKKCKHKIKMCEWQIFQSTKV